jgi:glucose/arabinose dehydrogenase
LSFLALTPARAGRIFSRNLLHLAIGVFLCLVAAVPGRAALPFSLTGPGVNPANFRVTAFATGLNYPLGMVELPDGSVLVTSTDGPGFFSSNARLVRLVDADHDGVADGPATVLFNGLSGGITSVRQAGNLVVVTGQSKPIYVLRVGPTVTSTYSEVGRINLTYPAGGWLHPHSALQVRPTPGRTNSYDLFFQVGSKVNFDVTTLTVALATTGLGGLTGTLKGDSVHAVTLIDEGTGVKATNLVQVLSGVRNPAGFAFHAETGDLYFEDNGIDGLIDANEPTSADELNLLPFDRIGGAAVEFYGFPSNYTAYRTGTIVGGQGLQPLVAFQPLPNPQTGAESEGPNDIAFSPPGFPSELNDGIFVTFHGKFNAGGLNNEENPLVFVNLKTTNYFHLIPPRLPGVGHLDGLLSTGDSLFVSDIATNGNLSTGAGRGVIYQIKALVGPPLKIRPLAGDVAVELEWRYGILQASERIDGGWQDVTNASPYRALTDQPRRFFRTRLP